MESDPLELELKKVVRLLGTEPGIAARIASAFNYEDSSPPIKYFLKSKVSDLVNYLKAGSQSHCLTWLQDRPGSR